MYHVSNIRSLVSAVYTTLEMIIFPLLRVREPEIQEEMKILDQVFREKDRTITEDKRKEKKKALSANEMSRGRTWKLEECERKGNSGRDGESEGQREKMERRRSDRKETEGIEICASGCQALSTCVIKAAGSRIPLTEC